MLLLLTNFSKKKYTTTTMLALWICMMVIGNFITTASAAATNETSSIKQQEDLNKTPVELENKTQKTFKKELKISATDKDGVVVITPPAKDDHTEKLFILDEKSLVENSGKGLEQQAPAAQEPKGSEKTGLLETVTKEAATVQHAQPYQHHIDEEFVLNDVDDMSESLKTGFYFFLILSSAAIVFIIFKIYRLRLSRAERKYGVQGDRSTQELTPLPISIEDGHSDDEDQTLFEVQRQNIRIL